jgi:putative sigma-54 modulation protein
MVIDIKGRNIPVSDDQRLRIERRFAKIGRQVSDLARLEVELSEERNPAIECRAVVEATLYLKGVKLRAREASHDMTCAIGEVAEDMSRQVKRHRDKRRHRRDTRGVEGEVGVVSPAT